MRKLFLFLAALLPAVPPQEPEALELGGTVFGSLDGEEPLLADVGPSLRYPFVPDRAGPVTLVLRSHDFDAFLRLEEEGGALVAEDDDGAIETNARLVLEAEEGRSYVVVVAAKHAGSGKFWVVAEPGVEPALEGADQLDASISYCVIAAADALKRGDEGRAAWCRLRQGVCQVERGEYREAVVALEFARDAYARRGERARGVEAWFSLGRAYFALSEYDDAREAFESALGHYLRVRDSSGQLRALLNLGSVDEAQGRSAAARENYEQALGIGEGLGDPLARVQALGRLGRVLIASEPERAAELLQTRHDLARDLEDRAEQARALGDLGRLYLAGDPQREAEALRAFEEQLELARALDDPSLVEEALGNLGRVQHAQSEFYRARELHEAALEAALASGNRANEAAALANLADIWFKMQDYARALGDAERARSIYADLDNQPQVAAVENDIALYAMSAGEHDRAEGLYRRMLEGVAQEDRREESRILSALGNVERTRGNPEAAFELLQRAHAMERELGLERISTLNQLGLVHVQRVEWQAAEAVLREALGLARERDDRDWQVYCLGSLANVTGAMGDVVEALELWRERLELARVLGKARMEAGTLGRIAGTLWSLGRHEEALREAERGLDLARKVDFESEEPWILITRGNALGSLGRAEESRAAYQAALEAGRRLGVRDVQVVCLGNLAVSWSLARDYEAAREPLGAALALVRGDGTTEMPVNEAWLLGTLAVVEVRGGEFERARELARSAEGLWLKLGRPKLRLECAVFEALASVAIHERDLAGAREAVAEIDRVNEHLRLNGRGTVEPVWERELSRTAQDVASLRWELGAPGERSAVVDWGLQRAGVSKAHELLAGVVEHRRGARSAEAMRQRKELRETGAQREAVLARMSRAIRDERPAREIDVLREEADELRDDLKRRQRRLRSVSPRDAAIDLPTGARAADLRAALVDERTAFVEFAEGRERLYAYVVGPDTEVMLDLGGREELEAAADAYVALIGDVSALGDVEAIASAGGELGRSLLAPVLAAAGEGVERLVIVPTAALSTLSFEALVLETPNAPESFADVRFAIDAVEICYGPSSPILVDLAAYGSRAAGGKILLLADPVYGEAAEAAEASSVGKSSLLGGNRALQVGQAFVRLPKTKDEALAIAGDLVSDEQAAELQALRRERSGSLAGRYLDLYLGEAASRERLAGSLAAYSTLHLAAHGYIDAEFPRRSGVALSVVDGDVDAAFFTIADVLELDLDANLVVLSACDTARGARKTSDGVGSMARAFMYSGARAVIASLWQVADWAAADTMKEMYAGALRRNLRPSAALREAKLAIRRSTAMRRGISIGGQDGGGGMAESGHPFFWAPFVYVGLP
jgi:tetratricopeptide (TPR) repeat protein